MYPLCVYPSVFPKTQKKLTTLRDDIETKQCNSIECTLHLWLDLYWNKYGNASTKKILNENYQIERVATKVITCRKPTVNRNALPSSLR